MLLTRNQLTYLTIELNSALDTGKYDDLPMAEASAHIEARDVVDWLRRRVPDMDLSLLFGQAELDYENGLWDIWGGYAGKERRKWGIENRGLCLLIAWTNELIQRNYFVPPAV